MQRPDTPDGLFVDGNPATGQKGTPITAEWLNALISVGAFLSGDTEPPDAGLGGPGDYYLCKTSHKMYGPKDQETGWPAGYTRVIGPQGETGATGLTGNPYKAYATLADANADLANIPADALVWINADATAANIGYWSKTGGVLVQSSYDRVAVEETARKYLTAQVRYTQKQFVSTLSYIGSGDVYPVITDSEGRVVLGVDSEGTLIGRNLAFLADVKTNIGVFFNKILAESLFYEYVNDEIYPVLTDKLGRVLLGYDANTGVLVGAFPNTINTSRTIPVGLSAADIPIITDINHLLFYGQSLSVGSQGQPAISLNQPYQNITFNGGPRAAYGDYSAFKPLVEDDLPAPDGGTNRGETTCSGAANYSSELAARENGIPPADHIVLSSTAGHGGYTIAQLEKGSAWYSYVLDHASNAKTLSQAALKTYAMHAFGWLQGEADVTAGTTFSTYRDKLLQLQSDVENDVKQISGQGTPVFCLTYQVSYGIRDSSKIALAQLDLAQKDSRFFLVSPCYHLPFYSDGTHLSALGYKWIGHYFGKAYKRLVIDNVLPEFISPISATARNNTVTVSFRVPVKPLVLDSITLAETTDYGFKIVDDTGAPAISSIVVQDGNSVVITIDRSLDTNPVVRYAMDYLGTGLNISNGASGNLRDSEDATVTISGADCPLYNVCPHFEIPIIPIF